MEDRLEKAELDFYKALEELQLNRVEVPLLSRAEVIRLIRIQRYIDGVLRFYTDKD